MPIPSKQNMIYSLLIKRIQEKFHPGDRLPPEARLAAEIGVARRTLRYTLDRLAAEGMIDRTNHGTFLRGNHPLPGQTSEPVSILVPCPDYITASGFYSSYLTQQMIWGAMAAAVEYGTYVVTLPISETNSPENIHWFQFRHLRKDNIVLFSGTWAPRLYPILAERGCRTGFVSDRKEKPPGFLEHHTDFIHYYLGDYWRCLRDAAVQLHEDGACRIVYFGRSRTDISKYGHDYFRNALQNMKLEYDERFYSLYEDTLSFPETLRLLGGLYRNLHFDGLIFDSNLFQEFPYPVDFFHETGIPASTRLVLNVSEFLKQPELPSHARVLHRPQKSSAWEMARFLLSGEKGQVTRKIEYQFPLLNEFFNETNLI